MSDRVQETIAAVWRIESPKLIARLSRMTRDVGRAEDLAADAFVAALAQWPNEKTEQLQNQLQHDGAEPDFATTYEEIADDMLRLMFVACHPVLAPAARVALTLKLLGGLTTAEIARAYLSSEVTIAQRIVRAKRTLSEARVAFDVPEGHDRLQRLPPLLEAVYLIFNEGYAATAGNDVLRPELVEDALRLGRMLARLMPHEAEVHGLVALMEIQASRIPARVASDGSAILLLDQDRGRWNHLLIARGLNALARAERLGSLGPYALQASIAACHARAATPGATDWQRIAAQYDALAVLMPSPVVELNRSVAVGMAYGPDAALPIVDALLDEPSLQRYHLLPSVRGDLLSKVGRLDEARREFERAFSLAGNARERTFLQKRAEECRTK